MMELTDWQINGNFFQHSGMEIFYQEHIQAKAEKLVLIHGYPTASWDWNKMWDGLAKDYQIIAPDMIGFGFSSKPETYQYTIHKQADMIEDLLDQKGYQSAHVIAHDYGDTVAQELLSRMLDRKALGAAGFEFKTLTLLNGGLFPETHRARPIQKLLNSPLGPFLSTLFSKKTLHKNFNRVFGPNTQPSNEEIDEFYDLILFNDGKKAIGKLIAYINDRRTYRERWVNCLQKSPVPIKLINGPADPVSGRHMVERYCELVRKDDHVFLENIGHYPNVEDPEGTLREFQKFIGENLN